MKYTLPLVLSPSLLIWCLLAAFISASDLPSSILNGLSISQSSHRLADEDDPRFSMRITYGETDLPATPVFMNAVELSARYAEMDYLGQTQQRHGIVLPAYQQVEIAVIPALPATTVEVRLVVMAINAAVMNMVYAKRWKESEAEIRWDDRVKAHMYFTEPLDDPVNSDNRTQHLIPIPTGLAPNNTSLSTNAQFNWVPVYKPYGQEILAKDVFLLALGAIRMIAPYPGTEKITGPFHVGSELVNANMQIYLHNRRFPRPVPPFFRYSHVLEAVRRIPGWELDRRRFAEFFCSIQVSRRPLGVLLMEKGHFVPDSMGPVENITISSTSE